MVRENDSASPENDWKPPNSSSTEASPSNSPSPVAETQQERQLDVTSKRSQRKRPVTTGVWPCKIHGCNKQFAREADLKRHQRTTKMHSMPSFSCPQCDATFTRTDALRRHQKSRHNGVVLDLLEQSLEHDENTQSRADTLLLSKSNDEIESCTTSSTQGTPTYSGPSNYYRLHTATISPHIPPRLQQLPLGTQITRTAPPWPMYATSWHNGLAPHSLAPIAYVVHAGYQPSPHYRPHTNTYSCFVPPAQTQFNNEINASLQVSSRSSSAQPPSDMDPSSDSISMLSGDTESKFSGTSRGKEITAEEVVAAVEAALRQAASQSQGSRTQIDADDNEHLSSTETLDASHTKPGQHLDDALMGLSDYGPGAMDSLLTLDGEPMLNPAELLTQESLAALSP